MDKNKKKILKLDFTGRLGTVNNITFIDSTGHLLKNELKYDVMKGFLVKDNDRFNKDIDVEIDQLPDQPFQVLVQGTDTKGKNFKKKTTAYELKYIFLGNHFSRLTYINEKNYNNNAFPQPILSVDVGLNSELIITGGRPSIITFEVTNLKSEAADVRFYCRDEQSILGSMQPYR